MDSMGFQWYFMISIGFQRDLKISMTFLQDFMGILMKILGLNETNGISMRCQRVFNENLRF